MDAPISCCLQFSELHREPTRDGVHINIAETRSLVRCEELAARKIFPCRSFNLSDSQVSLGAWIKGRASSFGLNQELQQSLPVHLGCGVYSNVGFIPSEFNTSDDTSRRKEVRPPSSEPPSWLDDSIDEATALGRLDKWLESFGVEPYSFSGLPSLDELKEEMPVDPIQKKNRFRCMCAVGRQSKLSRRSSPKVSSPSHGNSYTVNEKPSGDVVSDSPRKQDTSCNVVSSAVGLPTAKDKDLPVLSEEAKSVLRRVPRKQFVFPKHWQPVPSDWVPDFPGYLDLYSGVKGVAKCFSRLGDTWSITFELLDDETQDVLSESNQELINDLISSGAVSCLGAAIFCSSFSRAVRPPVRSRKEPTGFSNISFKMLGKVELGNKHSKWLACVIVLCEKFSVFWWVENPYLSYLWDQAEWVSIGSQDPSKYLKIDYCMIGAKWRKRTRIMTNTHLAGQSLMCDRRHTHNRLVGWCRMLKKPWTRVAQAYPQKLSYWIASALLIDSGNLPRRRKLDISSISRNQSARIGEAANPGPRPKKGASKVPRDVNQLESVELVLPGTNLLGTRVWAGFERWAANYLDEKTFHGLSLCPETLAEMLVGFGKYLFESGQSIYLLRRLVTFVQRRHPPFRSQLTKVWNLVSKWERLEPLCHRAPLPFVIFQAMIVTAMCWGWRRWAATTVLAFEGICRPGETLSALRRDLLLPSDLVVENPATCFLRVREPKGRFRGIGKVQHAKITSQTVVDFLEKIFGPVPRNEPLYAGCPSSYRRRWDRILLFLGIPIRLGLTPASLRGGGAVRAYRADEDIAKLLWRMRLKNVETLQHYLQEVGADSIFAELPPDSQNKVKMTCALYHSVLRS